VITFHSLIDFNLNKQEIIASRITNFINIEGFLVGEINYIFCDDAYLHQLNRKFLKHDSYTDVISFDYCSDSRLSGDIFISVERVRENAVLYETKFTSELHRVMIHGILHYMGYTDVTPQERKSMRSKEDEILLLHNLDV